MDYSLSVAKILSDFEKTWTFDLEDLRKPSTEQVFKNLIATYPENCQPRLEQEFFGYGAITPLLDCDQTQEIMINGRQEIWIEKLGRFERFHDHFLSDVTFKNFIDRICAEAQVHVDLSNPFANGRWRGYRLHLVCAPISHQAHHLTLRRHPQNPWTLDRLATGGWCTQTELLVLRSLLYKKQNVLVIGPKGAGKTYVLGACLKEIEPNERTVIIEDTDELSLPNTASTKLLTRVGTSSLPEITLSELVRQSLRMRPQRLAVGEVRGPEAKDLLLALATGHQGSWGTLHAQDAQQALLRLEMLIQMGAPQWSVQAIRQLLKLSVDALVVCGFEGGQRRLKGIFHVAAIESFGLLLDPLTASV